MTESERASAHEIVIGKLERGLIGDAEAIDQERQRLRDAMVEAAKAWLTGPSAAERTRMESAILALINFERLHGLKNK